MAGSQVIRRLFAIIELRTKVVSIGTFLVGIAYAWYASGKIDPVSASIMFFAVLALDMGTTAWNSYFDFRAGVDRKSDNRERDKVLVHEDVSPTTALYLALGLFGLAGLLGLILVLLHGPYLLLIGGFGMVVGFTYSGGPYPISRTPFGELAAGGCLGTLLFLTVYHTQTGVVDGDSVILALIPGALIASILAANNACDRIADSRSGRRTLAVLAGQVGAAGVLHGWMIIGIGAMVTAVSREVVPMSMLIFWLPAVGVYLLVHRTIHVLGCSSSTKSRTMQLVVLAYGVWSLSTMVGILVAGGGL